MNEILTGGVSLALLGVSCLVGSCTLLCFRKQTNFIWLYISVLLKVGGAFVYFAWCYEEQWLLADSVEYFEMGKVLVDGGYTPFEIDTYFQLTFLSGGPHIMYGLLNFLSQYTFGTYYYVPVFLNIFLTYVSAYYLFRIARFSGFSVAYSGSLFMFFVMHWDILTWSSFLNLKDILVLTLSVILFYYLLQVEVKQSLKNFVILLFLCFCFYWLRFYIPLLAMIAFLINISLNRLSIKLLKNVVVVSFVTGVVVYYVGIESISNNAEKLDINTSSLVIGVIRMLFTPQPWSLSSSYSFLAFSSWLHLVFFLPMCVGGFLLWRGSKSARVCIVYFIIAILLYGSFSELQGPRHRVQLLFILTWMQFHFIWVTLGKTGYFAVSKKLKNTDN